MDLSKEPNRTNITSTSATSTNTTSTSTTRRNPVNQPNHPTRHSISFPNNKTEVDPMPQMNKERRSSSFASPSSSYARRCSFLSPSMINNEKHQIYELNKGLNSSYYKSYNSDVPTYSISLKESQGFCWNQDLFASQYQQQSNSVFDDDDDEFEGDEEAIEDEDEDEDEDYYNYPYNNNRSLSMSHDNRTYKVRVIDIKVDDDE